MTEYIYEIVAFVTELIKANPNQSAWIVFAIAFVESMAILGSIFPGTMLLTPVGIMLGSGVLPLYETIISILLGALLGDWLSYLIGCYAHDYITEWSWVKNNRSVYDWFEDFVQKHGSFSLIIGRFFGPLRSSVPMFAGLFGMSFINFLFGALPSAVLWMLVYLGPGFLISRPEVYGYLQHELLPLFYNHMFFALLALSASILSVFFRKNKNIFFAMQFFSGFLLIAIAIDGNLLQAIDLMLSAFFKDVLPYKLAGYLEVFFEATTIIPSLCIAIIFGYMFGEKRRFRHFALMLLMLLLVIVVPAVKSIFFRLRPIYASQLTALFAGANSHSFPSGHVTLFFSLLSFIYYFRHRFNIRMLLAFYCISLVSGVLLVISRLSLMRHWPSDIVAGIFLGGLLSTIVFLVHRLIDSDENFSSKQILLALTSVLIISYIRCLYYV